MEQRLRIYINYIAAAALLMLGPLSAAQAGPQAQAGPYRVEVVTDPAVIPIDRAKLIVKITDAAGRPVEGAQVRTLVKMPTMDMGEREEPALPQPGQPGTYVAPAVFAMAGGYEATLQISGPQGTATAKVPLQTGQNTASSDGFPALAFLPWLIGLLAVAFVLYRMRRTGQRLNWRAVLNRQVIGGLLLLAVMLAGSMIAVRTLRRPGAMTPIEAQAMEMATPAPRGVAPVELATVERGTVESTVRYTGSAVAYVEQDVFPRVTGWITWMPFYAGDRVKRGQLLARLDTSQVEPQVAERRAAQAMAQQGVAVARAEYQQAQEEVRLARAELGQRKGGVAEAQASLSAAHEERAGAEAELAAAQTQVTDAQAQLEAAQADQEYWRAQIQRSAALLKEGAISGEEFQREKAQAENAEARVRQALARIRQVQAQVRAAQSAQRKADAMIRAAQAKVNQMESELQAHAAHVRTAQAGVNAARQRVAQAEAGVAQARAGLAAATTSQRYTEVRSLTDGVVTQRLISPGVLVNPGQAILKVAQIQPIRLQANVAETDLGRVQVGARVVVRGSGVGAERKLGPHLAARVTSITPAVDPVARTGVVETVVPNRDSRFLPGQYVIMEISTGRSERTLRIPSRALRWRTPPSGGVISARSTPFVWVAEPSEQEGEYTVRPVEVKAGRSDGERTEILSGLKEGQQVVTAGHQDLKEGNTVAPAPTLAAGQAGSAPAAHAGHGPDSAPAPQMDHSRQRAAATKYTCPMHPEVVQDRPGKCPKCQMDLVPSSADLPVGDSAGRKPGATETPDE